MSNFNKYSRYYDLLYKDKNYTSEAEYVLNLAKNYNKECNKFLELGCGTGNHAAVLCNKGFSVVGLERSEEMVALAKQKNISNFNPQVADITNFNINEKFDVALSLFHVISYLTDNEQLINCFNTVHQHLNINGIFIFDVWYSPAVYIQKPETRVKRISDEQIDVTRIAESTVYYNKNVVDVNYTIFIQDKATKITEVHHETHPMRHFSINEIKMLADFIGFDFVKAEEFLTANKTSENTWGVCMVLRKK